MFLRRQSRRFGHHQRVFLCTQPKRVPPEPYKKLWAVRLKGYTSYDDGLELQRRVCDHASDS